MCLSPNIAMASGYQYTQLNQGLMAIQTEFCDPFYHGRVE